ncbi:NACHT domain-containing protein [Altererythrobacter confluentis]|uniref:NACHT domain-containing protein n=1 Tax=Allopontixanthobacter confluentis TaxID=1849021 RepID=A0A6L7GG79_9SPHN|nr:NACHT domain-containing protein [Allopontixanthobacter confluentis]MXP14545.1 NACHT domain-containing protein [Allopontixanthobacter confluentis]
MAPMNPVSPSRDGDQFHYIRGAQLSLGLLKPDRDLVAVSIEGVPSSDDSTAGVEVIDLGLFYGSTELEKARRIHYRQFKHSTLRSEEPMTSSDLKKTLVGFAERYASLAEKFSAADIADRFRFEFETNRPIAQGASNALTELRDGVEGAHSKYLRQHVPLKGEPLRKFAKLVRLIPSVPDFLTQRRMLTHDTRAYLPDADRDAPLQLLNLVTTKATSEGASERAIRDLDVLHALGVSYDDLYPAEPRFDPVENVLVREPARTLAQKIIDGSDSVIVQADGGVGKSVFAQQLHSLMPHGSTVFVYDCFGAGSYRALSGYRHRARDVAVQIANEMSSAGLCDPLIPTTKADDTAFCRAFLARIDQASEQLAANPDALLLIVLDAADNSEAAAREAGQGHSFARMLLQERFPKNVRLVLTARPHRVETLAPPSDTALLELSPFSESETARNLEQRGVTATSPEVKEFHRLTSNNPRVQSVALEQGGPMRDVLGRLGTAPLTVEDTIQALLKRAVSNAKQTGGSAEAEQIDQICSALAILRPFVPLKLVADTAGVSEGLVRSFANDLKGPLLIRENAVQFRDEPTEHWFQETFGPQGDTLSHFIDRLRPLTTNSAYAAAVLPQMMLEAGQLEELVEITLEGKALPTNNEIARRDVEMQRLQFALKAAIQAERFKDATTLAMKAGGNAAVEERQQLLIGENTDLAARFLEPNQILEMISRREVSGGDWMGSDYAYRAALLSVQPELAGDASKELRFTQSWLGQWAAMIRDGKEHIGSPTDEDRAAMLFAELNINGADRCASHLRHWTHREVSFRTGRL